MRVFAMNTESDLPRSNVRRIVKAKLAELKGGGGDIHINKEAIAALSECARVFVHLLSATANDVCGERKRQTINVQDVIDALEELEFSDLVETLQGSIESECRAKR